ncbi:MAG: hypothetical protein ACRCX8_05780 [Sarcina sp.]
MRIAIDFGNGNTKIAYRKDDGVIEKILVRSLASTENLALDNVVKYKDQTVCFGVGEVLTEQDKTKRKYLEHSLLLASKLCGATSGKIEFAVGLPLNVFKSKRKESYITELSKIKGLKGDVDGTPINITVDTIKVFAEGFSTFIAYSKDIDQSPAALIDIGYKTTDVLTISKTNGKWKIDSYLTVNKGMFDVYKDMSKALFEDEIILKPEEVADRLENNPIIVTEDSGVNINNYVVAAAGTIEEIYREIKLNIADIGNRSSYVSGGGANVVTDLIPTKNRRSLGDIQKVVFGNVVGYLFQAEK